MFRSSPEFDGISGAYRKLKGTGEFSHDIVGESYYQEQLDYLCDGKTPDGHRKYVIAVLKPEPENEFDSNAVAVLINDIKVGHLPRNAAKSFKRFVSQPVAVDAVIVGGWLRSSTDEGNYGVKLDIDQ